MELEDQNVCVGLAREMKELGAPQDSVWYWTWAEWNDKVEWVLISQDERARLKKESFSAYTVAELGEMLPDSSHGEYVTIKDSGGMWLAWEIQKGLFDDGDCYIKAKTQVDAYAKMVIHLLKEGIIEK